MKQAFIRLGWVLLITSASAFLPYGAGLLAYKWGIFTQEELAMHIHYDQPNGFELYMWIWAHGMLGLVVIFLLGVLAVGLFQVIMWIIYG